MNHSKQEPNGPGPSLAEQVRQLQAANPGTRLIGAPDSEQDKEWPWRALLNRSARKRIHDDFNRDIARLNGMVIGTAQR